MEVLLKQFADELDACAPTRCSEAVSPSLSKRESHDLVALGLAEATENFFLVFRRGARTSGGVTLTLV